MNPEPQPDTGDITPHLPPRDQPSPSPQTASIQVDVAALSHQGKVRARNEDSFLVVRFGRFMQTLFTNLTVGEVPQEWGETGYGVLVADGIGGMACGEVASRSAIALFSKLALDTPDWILGRDAAHSPEVVRRAAQRFDEVNQGIIELASQMGLKGLGTTLTMAISLGMKLLVAHVGDSPAYLFRGGELQRLTRDHTLAQRLADASGMSTREMPARLQNALTHAIGTPESGGIPDIACFQLAGGDRLLLCTDGLTKMVEDATLATELGRPAAAAEVCQALIDRALEGGGKDNVTVVVAGYHIPVGP